MKSASAVRAEAKELNSESALITDAVFSLPKEVIAGLVSLLEEVNLASIVSNKFTSIMDKDRDDALGRKVKSNADLLLKTMDESELSLRLIARLSQTFDIAPRRYASTHDFEDAASDIITASIVALRKSNKSFTGSTLQDLVQFNVEIMFGEVGQRFEGLASEQQVNLLSAIRDLIAQLPHEQQAELRQKLGIDDLSDEYLRTALVSGSLASVFAGAVSIGGFGFYTGAVSLLATVAGFVGLTLPFAVYTSLTSAVAVVSNPLLILPALSFGGVYLYRTQNETLRQRLAVNTVVQLALGGSSIEASSLVRAKRQRVVSLWQEATGVAQDAARRFLEDQNELKTRETELSSLQNELRRLEEQKAFAFTEKEKVLAKFRIEVAEHCEDIVRGEWGYDAQPLGIALAESIKSKERIVARELTGNGVSRLVGKLDRVLDGFSANKEVASSLKRAVDEIVIFYTRGKLCAPGIATQLLIELVAADGQVLTCESTATTLNAKVEAKRIDIESAKQKRSSSQSKAEQAKKRYWGLLL